MTNAENPRSLSFKITIDPKDYQKAKTDTSVWPYQVGVRRFKHSNPTRSGTAHQGTEESASRSQRHYPGYQGHHERLNNQQRENEQNFV